MIPQPRLALPGRPKPYVMAHRGSRAVLPENTLIAFRQALQDGADILETDLHLTVDGELVCIHDATVDRTTDGQGSVAGFTLVQLQKLNAAATHPGINRQSVPTLAELAAIIPADRALALELKTDRFLEEAVCRQLIAVLRKTETLERSVALSFSLPRLRAIQRYAPGLPVGLITMRRVWPRAGMDMTGPIWPLAVLNPLYGWLAHRAGQLFCPLDPTPDRRLWWYRLIGSDAVLTDNPAQTVKALGR